MSLAWEVTEQDVVDVCRRLEWHFSASVISNLHDQLEYHLIEEAVLSCTDFEGQCNAALDEIEKQLRQVIE